MNKRTQRGNAFVIVLLGIALFAALSFLVSRSMQSETTSRMSNREMKLAASEIIEYGSRIERAVNKLRRRGCSENDISFDGHQGFSKEEDDDPYSYNNPSAPGDFRCHVFHPSGGNVAPKLPVQRKAAVDVDDVPNNAMHPESFKITATKMDGNGTDAGATGTDLVVQIGTLKYDVCAIINTELQLNLPTNPPTDTYDCGNDLFTGSFSNCANAVGDNVTELEGQTAYCIGTTGPYYSYFQLLIPR